MGVILSLVLLLAAVSVLFLGVAKPASAVKHRKDEVRLNKINPFLSMHLDLSEPAMDPVSSPSPASSSTPVTWSLSGRSTSSIHLQAAALRQADQVLLHHPRQRRHRCGSSPATAGLHRIYFKLSDANLLQHYTSPEMTSTEGSVSPPQPLLYAKRPFRSGVFDASQRRRAHRRRRHRHQDFTQRHVSLASFYVSTRVGVRGTSCCCLSPIGAWFVFYTFVKRKKEGHGGPEEPLSTALKAAHTRPTKERKGRNFEMAVLAGSPFRSLFSPGAVAAPRRIDTAPAPLLFRSRSPLAGALLFLSLCAVAGVRSLSSTQMESASTTVPSIVVYVTVPNREAGKKLAGSIISEKLAACVNIVPGVESVYWWEGKVQSDAEELLIIKTRESLLDALTEHVKANHEYDVPEVIALPIKGGNLKYLEWLKNSTREN